MKRFTFSLETVQRVRTRNEEVKKREYGEALHEVESAAARLEKTSWYTAQLAQELKQTRTGAIDLHSTIVALQYKHHLERVLVEQRRQFSRAAVEAENKRILLVKASRQRNVIDRLREKRYKGFLQQIEREEQKALDEAAGIAAARGMMRGEARP